MNRCKTCKHWAQTTDWKYNGAINEGKCDELNHSDKVTIYLQTGWDGGYVDYVETEEDFGCVKHEMKE